MDSPSGVVKVNGVIWFSLTVKQVLVSLKPSDFYRHILETAPRYYVWHGMTDWQIPSGLACSRRAITWY